MLRGDMTVVEDRARMVTLAAAMGAGATSITVENAYNIPDAGTLITATETLTYNAVDSSTGIITLAAPSVGSALIGDTFALGSGAVDRIAYVRLGEEDEDSVAVTIPWSMADLFTTGLQSPPPTALIEEHGIGEYILVDVEQDATEVPTKRPYIKVGDPIPTDSVPPVAVSAPTVRGAIGALIVTWTPVNNNDPVTYDIHVSVTSGFTPGVGTLVATVDGSMLWVRTLTDGTPLSYTTTYYVKVIARDKDGSASASPEASGTPTQVDTPDIHSDAIQANHIEAGAITADKLAAVIVLSSILKTAESGQRVEIQQNGITLYAADGSAWAFLPTSGDPYFRGNLEAVGLTVLGSMLLRAGSVNTLEAGASLVMKDKVADPVTAPTISTFYDTVQLVSVPAPYVRSNLFYAASATGGVPSYYTVNYSRHSIEEIRVSSGVVMVEGGWAGMADTHDVYGVVRVGTNVFCLVKRNGKYRLEKRVGSTLAYDSLADLNVDSYILPGTGRPCLGTDGTNVIVFTLNAGGFITGHAFNTSLAFVSTTVLGDTSYGTYSSGGTLDEGRTLYGAVLRTEGGTQYWFVLQGKPSQGATDIVALRTSDHTTQNVGFPAAGGAAGGLAHDGTNFLTRSNPTSQNLTKYANTLTTGDFNTVWAKYAYENGALTTKASPVAYRAIPRRSRIRISTPPLPSGADSMAAYVGIGTPTEPADSAKWKQFDVAAGVGDVPESYLTSGTATPTASTFGAGTPAVLKSENGSPLLRADGIPRCKVKNGGGVSCTDNTQTVIPPANADRDTDNFWDGSAAYVILPYTGQYEVLCQLSFAVNNTGRRTVTLQSAPAPYTTWTDMGADLFASAATVGTDRSTVQIAAMLDGTAGTGIRIRALQNSGGALNCQMRMTMMFSGPS